MHPPRPGHRRTCERRLTRWAAVVLACLTLLVVESPGAWAHDVLISSDPADGATLAAPPTSVSFTFDEPVQNFQPVVSLIGPDGQQYRSGSAEVNGSVVSSAVAPGPAGAWIAAYRVVSGDGHPVTGQIRFTVATGSSPGGGQSTTSTVPPTSPPPQAAATGGSGLPAWAWIGLAVLAALVVTAAVILPRRARRQAGG